MIWEKLLILTIISIQYSSEFNVNPRIFGGNKVPNTENEKKYPYMVLITVRVDSGKYIPLCGGVILDTRWILTAAHCFDGDGEEFETANNVQIRAGVVDYTKPDSKSQTVQAKELHRHKEWNLNGHLINDIALIELETDLKYYPKDVESIALAPDNHDALAGKNGIILGWGASNLEQTEYPKNLMEARAKITDSVEDCRGKVYLDAGGKKMSPRLYDYQFCVAQEPKIPRPCEGDSGGPFIQIIDNKPVILGVLSYSSAVDNGETVECHAPAIYTDVTKFRSFIVDIMKKK